jgi:hypothetical protein
MLISSFLDSQKSMHKIIAPQVLGMIQSLFDQSERLLRFIGGWCARESNEFYNYFSNIFLIKGNTDIENFGRLFLYYWWSN